ncbi:MAG: hypothetical protein ACTHK7_01840, partial [Aureliella sp.]
TTFWLVLADQFHKAGIEAPQLVARAKEIIDSDFDLSRPERLEMSQADRTKRQKMLHKLKEKLSEPTSARVRKTLKSPQPLLMRLGDIVIFPVNEREQAINPHFKPSGKQPSGWRAACIVQATQVFGYLACYTPLVNTTTHNVDEIPNVDSLVRSGLWELRRPGTCSKTHFGRMQFQVIGNFSLAPDRIKQEFPNMRDGRYQAVHDISISNALSDNQPPGRRLEPCPRIEGLKPILREHA